MIDTDKYEGHTEGPWRLGGNTIWGGEEDNYISLALDLEGSFYQPKDPVLMADAPLLLEEVKRLREGIKAYLKITDERPHNYIRENREKLRKLIE